MVSANRGQAQSELQSVNLWHHDSGLKVPGAWLAKDSVRDVYLTQRVGETKVLLRKAIVGCQGDGVAEIRSLGDTLERCRARS